jgi:hypothetical protein
MGHNALFNNQTGITNVAIGQRASRNSTTSSDNVAIGNRALYCNTSGGYNVAIGRAALYNAAYNPGNGRDSTDNIGIGLKANFSICGASATIAIGTCANYASVTGGGTVAVGSRALRFNTGESNTAIGSSALYNVTGNCNTAIGSRANLYITNVNYTIAVGRNALTTNNSYHTVWGSAANNVYNCVWAAWTTVSDCRDKTNIQPLSRNLGLPFIKKLNPVSFNWDTRQSYVDKCDFEYGEKDGTLVGERKEYGIIAQDVRKALDELEEQFDGLKYNAEQDAYRFTYEALIAPLIKSVQELSERLEAVEEKLK